jgi:hypothetical protein
MLALLASSALIVVLAGKTQHATQPPSIQPPTLETKASPASAVSIQSQAQAKTNPPSQPSSHSSASSTDVVSQILSKNTSAEVRREALYQLTQTHSDAATRSLIEIAASSVDAKDESSRLDVSLRITALEALDQRMASGEATSSAITTVLEKQTHPTLLFFARISLEGVTSGRPGKLTRFIDRAFSEVGEG